MSSCSNPASINGVPLHREGETLPAEDLRQRACVELLRQAAIRAGLLPENDPPQLDGTTTEVASSAIEALLDRELNLPEPSEDACRRYYAANLGKFTVGERVSARHVLFAVTPGVDVTALRLHAEACLLELRCSDRQADDRFTQVARETSNCPTGVNGGQLGWLTAGDCAPEFARELFGTKEIGVLSRLVHSRFGLHIVEILAREPGKVPTFDTVRSAVVQALHQQTFATTLRQYLQLLAGQARVDGLSLDEAKTPLVQ